MIRASLVSITLAALPALTNAQEILDRVDQALTFSAFDNRLRSRVSGLIDLEGYLFNRPAPGVLQTESGALFNPRLTLFLDAQLGEHVYGFMQARVDRGFDPSDGPAQARLDEYAIRYTPFPDGRLNLQVGQFATVVGNWVERHLSWDNPFITAPLPYEQITAIYDTEAPSSPADFLAIDPSEKYEYVPLIWGPSYATGASASGKLGKFQYALEVKNASLSSRPEAWSIADRDFAHPTFSGRIGFQPDLILNFGLSASAGPYFEHEAAVTLPPGRNIGDYRQFLLGQDIRFAWRHLQLWAEVYESRFEVPNVGSADSLAYYLEAKYKFTPQLFGALRWNQQYFSSIDTAPGLREKWGHDISRFDTALGYRFTEHMQLKIQHSIQHEERARRDFAHLLAAQFTLRF